MAVSHTVMDCTLHSKKVFNCSICLQDIYHPRYEKLKWAPVHRIDVEPDSKLDKCLQHLTECNNWITHISSINGSYNWALNNRAKRCVYWKQLPDEKIIRVFRTNYNETNDAMPKITKYFTYNLQDDEKDLTCCDGAMVSPLGYSRTAYATHVIFFSCSSCRCFKPLYVHQFDDEFAAYDYCYNC